MFTSRYIYFAFPWAATAAIAFATVSSSPKNWNLNLFLFRQSYDMQSISQVWKNYCVWKNSHHGLPSWIGSVSCFHPIRTQKGFLSEDWAALFLHCSAHLNAWQFLWENSHGLQLKFSCLPWSVNIEMHSYKG